MDIKGVGTIPDTEISLKAVRAQGAGGQNVNKVSTAIHLRFDIAGSSLADPIKAKLLESSDSRITTDGTIVIKAQRHRTQEKNRKDALSRLAEMIAHAGRKERRRRKTKPTAASKNRRLQGKDHRGRIKKLRGPVDY